MRYVLLGALLALMLLFPVLGTAVLGLAAAVLSQPLVVAFVLGLAAGVHLHRKRWAR